MSEPNIRIEHRFPVTNDDDFFQLRMIGYNDFRYLDGWEYFRIYSWTSLHYVRNGTGKLFIKGNEYDIQAGDLFVIPANEPIMYYPNPDDPWRYYWINFHTESQFEIEKRIGLNADKPTKATKNPEKIALLFDELFSFGDPNLDLYYKTLAVVMEILSSEQEFTVSPIAITSQKNALISEAKQIIALNSFHSDFSVSALPKMLFISQRHLGKLFKEQTGMTPVAYLAEVRLNHASNLLHKGDYTVSELCKAVGFGDELYFMKQFKKKFGLTIKQYKNKISTF